MRLLFATCSAPGYMAPPLLAAEQVNCGPDWPDREVGGHFLSLQTPRGEYDLAAVAARLPAHQRPDAVVCLVDASWRALPRNLGAFKCPKVLLVADTHHLVQPLVGMVGYARSEPFDRRVVLYDRHHAEILQAAGLRHLHWFPGLTFPHEDAIVRAARCASGRRAELAFVGQIGICHPRRLRLLTHLRAQRIPVAVRALSQRAALPFYGSSLVGFNASLNGDLNLRVFEILASGAMLLTDALAPASGLTGLLRPGVEVQTYETDAEMVERARAAMARPAEAEAIGAAGARWFDEHFSAGARRRAFAALVADGVSRPEFALPSGRTLVPVEWEPARWARLTAGYEYVQELHRNLDRVTVALDDSVPEEFARMCATLPRLTCRRGALEKAGRVDFLVVGRRSYGSPALVGATQVWSWEDPGPERVALARRCASMGLVLVQPELGVFSRQRVNSHQNDGTVALVRLEQGGYEDALRLAHRELERNPGSVDALFVLLELAQETSKQDVFASTLARLRRLAPYHPRLDAVLGADAETIRRRRTLRLISQAQGHLDGERWEQCAASLRDALRADPAAAEAHWVSGKLALAQGTREAALSHVARATQHAPERPDYWYEHARLLLDLGRTLDALSALVHVTRLAPEEFDYQFALGETALAAGQPRLAAEALAESVRLRPGHRRAGERLEVARAEAGRMATGPRDLLLAHVEVTRLQGTGVLLERFFPEAGEFVTVRSRTLYGGKVDFGGVHFSLDLPGLDEAARRAVLQRLLAPYSIRRILCVPFFATDYQHALAARELTGAPLCTYVMDDQALHSRAVPEELAQRLFAASALRLAISPEMVGEYRSWFGCSFGLLPPIVTNRRDEAPNRWRPGSGASRSCAMVGNIWSARQFEQVRAFARAASLRIDWYGNSKVAWLPQDRAALEADGIFCRGFLPEPELAERLAEHPFVVLPSGALDGSEDNEWLTRLSLPSRMVFIVTKTQTPMLVLGSPRTAAARFVAQFGLGLSSNYDAAEAEETIAALVDPVRRSGMLASARRVASCFLVPDAGAWIWRSLAAGRPEPTPFDTEFAACPEMQALEPDAGGGPIGAEAAAAIERLAAQLADPAAHDGRLPPDEPRQRADVRGTVLFLQEALREFGNVSRRLLAVERLALRVGSNRGVFVTWAELLEVSGDRAGAAAKARQALAIFYDDVYTQTLFLRCAGEVNFHQNAGDRFCPHPFENFEIYRDGSVYACNCTQVPFPIGNVYRQTKEEIWQSPAARAIRASILDGSYRFCSPMTCWNRFDLPRKAEQPERFAHLQAIGIDGREPPRHLNLSYDLSCNLSCPSCRHAPIMANQEERGQLARVRDDVVLPLLREPAAESVYITGSGDAFGSPHFRSVLKELCRPEYAHVQITLGTNGQLITPRLWEEFSPLHRRIRDITVSIDGACRETYEDLRRGASWERICRAMEVLAASRRAGHIRRIMVNMVVQERNFREMRPLLKLCHGWAVDGIRFYRIRQWGHVVPEAYLASDIANPLHPRHQALLNELAHPDFSADIVDHYDMWVLIDQVRAANRAVRAVA